jgi:integrase
VARPARSGLKPGSGRERATFTIDELRVLLDEARQFRPREPHKFWITALAIYTGARAEELAQLNIHKDIARDADSGHWYIDIHEDDGGSVKTLAGWRKVPLHPVLINAGFLDYVDKLKKAGATRPFPGWKPRVDPTHGGQIFAHEAIKWSGRQLEKLRAAGKITRPKLTYLHSTRHALVNHLKQKLVDEGLRSAIVGQESGGINQNRYGKGYTVKLLGDTLVENLPEYATLIE